MMLRSTVTAVAICLAAHSACDAKTTGSGAGHTIVAQHAKSAGYRITLDGRPLYTATDAASVDVVGVYGGQAHAFGLIAENSDGNACPTLFRAVDIRTPPAVSKPFGTCSDIPKNMHVDADRLSVTLPRMDGQGDAIYTYAAGHLTKTSRLNVYRPTGPAHAPDDDLAALVKGRTLDDVVQVRAVALAVSNIMGAQAFTASRKRIQGGVQRAFETRGGVAFASACKPHSCGDSRTAWAFDHAGHAWASWTEDGRTTVYGNPPTTVRKLLEPPLR